MKVKITCFWVSDQEVIHLIKKYAFGETRWKDIQFVTDESYDRLVILTFPHQDTQKYDLKKAITFLTEPPVSNHNRKHETSIIQPMFLPLPMWI